MSRSHRCPAPLRICCPDPMVHTASELSVMLGAAGTLVPLGDAAGVRLGSVVPVNVQLLPVH